MASRNYDRIRQGIKQVEGRLYPQRFSADPQRQVLPKLGKAKQSIGALQRGTFLLQRRLPDVIQDTTQELEAYPLCEIAGGDYAILHRCVGDATGGFWAAVPCTSANQPTYECEEWENGTFTPPQLAIEDLPADNGAFQGWADDVNGTHQMQFEQDPVDPDLDFPGAVKPACRAFVVLQVPNNVTTGDSSWPEGPLRIDFLSVGGGLGDPTFGRVVSLRFNAGVRRIPTVPGDSFALVTYPEGLGANEYPRTSTGHLRGQSYKLWDKTRATSSDAALLAWLNNGTFTVYP